MSDGEPEEQAPPADPSPTPEGRTAGTARRRKRRYPATAAAEPERAAEASSEETETAAEPALEDEAVPAFARAFPREPALDALVAAFEAGDYARVRREAPALARQTDDDAVRAAARELRRRLDPDPLALYLLGAAALLLLFLAGWYWAHPHTL